MEWIPTTRFLGTTRVSLRLRHRVPSQFGMGDTGGKTGSVIHQFTGEPTENRPVSCHDRHGATLTLRAFCALVIFDFCLKLLGREGIKTL